MTQPSTSRRNLLSLGAVGVAAVTVAASGTGAQAQSSTNTLQRIRDSGELKIGVAQGEPWFYKDARSNEWYGIGWGVGVALARDLGVKPVPVETTWGNAVAGLQAGQFDVMFVLDATPQRALAIDFPVEPMFWYAQGLLVRDGLTAKSWAEFNKPEVRIGVVLGTSPDRDITTRLPNAQIERFPSGDETAAAFQAGRVDAISLFHPALVMLQARVKKGTVVLPEPIRASSTSAGVRRDTDKTWRDWLGLSLAYYYATGETQRIYEDYLKFRSIDVSKAPAIVRELWK
ncbi:transporter substrate-binding domain-containing protein [Bradyrhizobium sp. UFLA05-112]